MTPLSAVQDLDLVARLRSGPSCGHGAAWNALTIEAVDEIERLRRSVESVQALNLKFASDMNERTMLEQAEIERLRGELAQVSKSYNLAMSSRLEWRRQAETAWREACEACAKVADEAASRADLALNDLSLAFERYGMQCRKDAATDIAAAIRQLAERERK